MKKKIDKIVHSKFFIIILIGILILTTALVGTYAWFTWSSSDNTRITMTIGDIVDITFDEGNEINDTLYPVFNYDDGLSTEFTINNRMVGIDDLPYVVYFNITSIAPELTKDKDVRYVVLENDTVVSEGHLQGIKNSTELPLYNGTLFSGTTDCRVYIYMDGNKENDREMIGKSIVGNIMIEAIPVTPVEDFEYFLSSEYYQNGSNYVLDYPVGETRTVALPVSDEPVEENEILLTKYIGTSPNVNVPNTYIIDGVTYNVKIASYFYIDSNSDNPTNGGTFYRNETIKNVIIGNNIKSISYTEEEWIFTKNSYYGLFMYCTNLINASVMSDAITDLTYTFARCTSLVNAPKLPKSATTMGGTFSSCTSLVSAPVIPSSVTYMNGTFSNCTSLVNAPVLPNSVTDITYMFSNCVNLSEAPAIPGSVTRMNSTFQNCTSLVKVPEIPSSVTNMYATFRYCTNLTDTVRINSSDVSSPGYIFDGTSKPITVEVPAGSTTYTKLSALTTSNGMPSNVTIKQY